MRSRAEQKAIQRIKRTSNLDEPVVIVQGSKEHEAPSMRQKPETTKISNYAYKPLLKQWLQKAEEKKSAEPKSIDKSLLQMMEKSNEETKAAEPIDENEGAYVNMKELFETVLNCYDLANTVQDFEFPEISKAIEKLTYFMEAITKGGKRLGEANLSRLGMKVNIPKEGGA